MATLSVSDANLTTRELKVLLRQVMFSSQTQADATVVEPVSRGE